MTNTKITAPDIPNAAYPDGGYPSKGARLGPAWTDIWRAFAKEPDAFHDVYPIAEKLARKYELSPATLIGLVKRAATAGLLDREPRPINTGDRGNRNRTTYRISLTAREPESFE